ncbi:hypothetical protein [Aquamicrobium terrae]|uniref:PepSY domain-containing protein n=1 Tax=Aquamicrobium terrae TaxID=1324945 RepID=A0ABV2N390_9HYPH
MKRLIIFLASGAAFAVIGATPALAADDRRLLRHLGHGIMDRDLSEHYARHGFHDDDAHGSKWGNSRLNRDDDDDDDDGGRRRHGGGRDDDDDDDDDD